MGVVGDARIVPGVGEGCFCDQQLARGSTFGLLRLEADATSGGVEVHYRVAVVPENC